MHVSALGQAMLGQLLGNLVDALLQLAHDCWVGRLLGIPKSAGRGCKLGSCGRELALRRKLLCQPVHAVLQAL